MDLITGKLLHVYGANLTVKPGNLPKLMIISSACNALSCIIHELDDVPYLRESESQTLMHRVSTNSVHAIQYKAMELLDEQVNRTNALEELDGFANVKCQEKSEVSHAYVAYHHKMV